MAGVGYTNNDADPNTATTLYDIDTATDQVSIQAPPNNGNLNPVGKLGVDTNAVVGFDIFSDLDAARPRTSGVRLAHRRRPGRPVRDRPVHRPGVAPGNFGRRGRHRHPAGPLLTGRGRYEPPHYRRAGRPQPRPTRSRPPAVRRRRPGGPQGGQGRPEGIGGEDGLELGALAGELPPVAALPVARKRRSASTGQRLSATAVRPSASAAPRASAASHGNSTARAPSPRPGGAGIRRSRPRPAVSQADAPAGVGHRPATWCTSVMDRRPPCGVAPVQRCRGCLCPRSRANRRCPISARQVTCHASTIWPRSWLRCWGSSSRGSGGMQATRPPPRWRVDHPRPARRRPGAGVVPARRRATPTAAWPPTRWCSAAGPPVATTTSCWARSASPSARSTAGCGTTPSSTPSWPSPCSRRWRPTSRPTIARPLVVEQSNSSVVYDERLILKLFRRVHPEPNPDVEITEILGERGLPARRAPARRAALRRRRPGRRAAVPAGLDRRLEPGPHVAARPARHPHAARGGRRRLRARGRSRSAR